MKFAAVVAAALATVAYASPAAYPPPPPKGCKPATYSCLPGNNGWQVCDTSGKWEFAGTCPPHTVCKFYQPSLSPYCVPPNFQFP